MVAKRVLRGEKLPFEDAKTLFDAIFDGKYPDTVVSAVLAVMALRGETPEEVAAAIASADERKVKVEHSLHPVVDTCGTGGDGSSTFNISTASSFVLRALGIYVAKHGNRAVTGSVGSADIVEMLGVRVCKSKEEAEDELRKKGYAFLFAPGFHPAFARVAPVRRSLGIPTIFNLLGPQVNPCSPSAQLIGVYSPPKAEVVARALALMGRKNRVVVSSERRVDEVDTMGKTYVYVVDGGVRSFEFEAKSILGEEFDIPRVRGPEESKEIFLGAIEGRHREASKTVALNAAFALYAAGICDIGEGYRMALGAIRDGQVKDTLRELAGGVS